MREKVIRTTSQDLKSPHQKDEGITTRSTKRTNRNEDLLCPKSTNDWMDRQHMYIDGMHRRQGIEKEAARLLRAL